MQTSQEVKNLTAALVKAQAAFPDIPKDKEVQAGARKYRYADLATIIEKTRKPLTDHGLAVCMGTEMKDDSFLLTCRISHSTGEWMEAQYPMPKDQGSQVIGAAMTYGRRYLLSALLNICADDDTDGEEAKDVPHGRGNGKTFTTDPRQQKKDEAKHQKKVEESWKEAKADPHEKPKDSGMANVTVKSIAPGNHPKIKFSILETSGGRFLVMGENANYMEIMQTAQAAALSKHQVVIEFHLNDKNSQVADSLRMEG